MALSEGAMDELNLEIITQIEEAYKKLEGYFQDIQIRKKQKIDQIISEIERFDGSSLKKIREELNVDLLDIAISSNIQISHLRNIENEIFEALPSDVYLRGYLKNYADYVSLDAIRVVEDYMQDYQQWKLGKF